MYTLKRSEWIDPNDPDEKVQSLSGKDYISMRFIDDCLGWGWRPTPIRKRCTHEFTCCIECIDDWATDYDIRWDRTSGARAMRDEIVRLGVPCHGVTTGI